jgi:hypothetical protein
VRELPTVRIHLADALLFIHPVQWRENFTIRHLACSATLVAVCGNQSKVYRASTPLVLGFVFEENRRKRRDKKKQGISLCSERKETATACIMYIYVQRHRLIHERALHTPSYPMDRRRNQQLQEPTTWTTIVHGRTEDEVVARY